MVLILKLIKWHYPPRNLIFKIEIFYAKYKIKLDLTKENNLLIQNDKKNARDLKIYWANHSNIILCKSIIINQKILLV